MAGKKEWIIADGYLPQKSSSSFVSHESLCILNTGENDASISIIVYFEDRDPMDNFTAVCGAKRTNHIRLDKIEDAMGNKIPAGVPYALEVKSDYPIIVQHTRMDTTQSEMALMTSMGY